MSRRTEHAAVLLPLAVMVLAVACGPRPPAREEEATSVSVELVEPTEISAEAYANARVEGLSEALVYASTPGNVEEVLVSVGDTVTAGRRLVRLDTDQQASAGVAVAQASVSAARANVDNTESNYQRMQSLYEAGAVSLQQLEASETALESAQAQLDQAQAGYSQATTSRAISWVIAPFDGQVGRVWARVGNSSAGSPLLSITNPQTVVARILLPASDVHELEVGLPAYITVSSLDDESFPGVVTEASGTVDQMSGLVPVTVRFDDTEGRLVPGMAGRVAVLVETSEQAVVVPESAVRRTHGGYQAAVVSDGAAEIRELETGISNRGMMEVTSGLSFGDSLIVRGHVMLEDGAAVEVVDR